MALKSEIPNEAKLEKVNDILKWRGLTLAKLCDRILRHPIEDPLCIQGAKFNEETLAAIRDANEGKNLTVYNSFADFKKAMDAL